VIGYVSKWAEFIVTPTKDSTIVIKFFKKNIFIRFGTLRALLSDDGTDFCKKLVECVLKKYGVFHKVATSNYSQISV